MMFWRASGLRLGSFSTLHCASLTVNGPGISSDGLYRLTLSEVVGDGSLVWLGDSFDGLAE
jgi:hypothetical protein